MSWSSATLSDASSLEKHEAEINDLTSSDWNDKISVAKELIGDRIEIALKDRGYDDYIDYTNDEDIKDLVANPTVMNLSSDFLTLSLIFVDLASGQETGTYAWKRDYYNDKYQEQMEIDLQRIDLDLDQDDDTDIYNEDITDFGKVIR